MNILLLKVTIIREMLVIKEIYFDIVSMVSVETFTRKRKEKWQ